MSGRRRWAHDAERTNLQPEHEDRLRTLGAAAPPSSAESTGLRRSQHFSPLTQPPRTVPNRTPNHPTDGPARPDRRAEAQLTGASRWQVGRPQPRCFAGRLAAHSLDAEDLGSFRIDRDVHPLAVGGGMEGLNAFLPDWWLKTPTESADDPPKPDRGHYPYARPLRGGWRKQSMGRGSQPLKMNTSVKSSANNVAIAVIVTKISPKQRKRCEGRTL